MTRENYEQKSTFKSTCPYQQGQEITFSAPKVPINCSLYSETTGSCSRAMYKKSGDNLPTCAIESGKKIRKTKPRSFGLVDAVTSQPLKNVMGNYGR